MSAPNAKRPLPFCRERARWRVSLARPTTCAGVYATSSERHRACSVRQNGCHESASAGPYPDILTVRRAELRQLLEESRELNERIETVADDVRRLSRPIVLERRRRAFVRWGERILWASIAGGGIACFAFCYRAAYLELEVAKIQAARQYARKVKDVADVHFRTAPFAGMCPTVKNLVDDKELAAFDADDPWATPFRIECADGEIHVYSNGPDTKPGTADDIRDDSSPQELGR